MPNLSTILAPHLLTPSTLAKNNADILWAEHTLVTPNLLLTPPYLVSTPTTSHQARIQLELIVKWHLAVTSQLSRAVKRDTEVLWTEDYGVLKKLGDVLVERAGVWRWKVGVLEGREREGREVVEGKRKRKRERERVGRGNEVNYGFGASTNIIPHKGKEGAERKDEIHVVDGDEVARPVKKVRVDGLDGEEEVQCMDGSAGEK